MPDQPAPEVVHADRTVTRLSADSEPVAEIEPGHPVMFETTDRSYHGLSGESIDRGFVDFREVNRLTGPVRISGAEPGDALGFSIESIEVESPVHVVYNAGWRSRMFGIHRSHVRSYPIVERLVQVGDGISIPLSPMLGCMATAPARGYLSSLGPCRSTGGNLDIPEIVAGATVWLPVRVPGGLFALGDVHASMGYGEPVGGGLECAGRVVGRFHLKKRRTLPGVRIERASSIHFVGSHATDHDEASSRAVSVAWDWLRDECGLSEEHGLAVSAALLNLSTGGPAGANMVASFELDTLRASGVQVNLLRFMVPAAD